LVECFLRLTSCTLYNANSRLMEFIKMSGVITKGGRVIYTFPSKPKEKK
jgi:hypothetical protein